jgi:hypothetical protein
MPQKPSIPGQPGQNHDAKLAPIEKRSTHVPAGRFGQFPAWKRAFKKKKDGRRCNDSRNWKHVFLLFIRLELSRIQLDILDHRPSLLVRDGRP